MKRLLGLCLVAVIVSSSNTSSRADEPDPGAIVDKGIKALGGEEKLKKAAAISWKSKGKMTIMDNVNEFTTQFTADGLDHQRSEVAGEFMGNEFKMVVVLNVDKGWRKFADNEAMPMDDDAITNEKHSLAIQVIPTTLMAIKGKAFKLASAPEQKVGDKPAVGVKVTEPDGKSFTIYFDKESGLPVKLVSTMVGFMGEDYEMETTYADYKDFNGIKKATKIISKRDGQPFLESEISDFKVMGKAPTATFTEPK